MAESEDEDVSVAQDNDEEVRTNPTTTNIQLSSAVKIPPFWNARPDLWFLQVETQFRMKKITSNATKYDHLVSSLPSETMEIVADFLINPPDDNKYVLLKKLLISRCTETEERRLDSLLNKVDIGDSKPSELYRQMEALAGDNSLINKQLLRKLWLQKLPLTIQPCIIAMEETLAQEQLFTVADKIHASTDKPKISAISTKGSSRNPAISGAESDDVRTYFTQLTTRIEQLEKNFSRSRSRFRSISNHRDYSRNRSRNRSNRDNATKKYDSCWYHHKFGALANKCIAPCKFQKPSEPKN